MKNHIRRKISALLTCVALGGGTLVQAGCDTSSSDPGDGDNARFVTIERITLANIENLAEGEVLALQLDDGLMYEVSADALHAGADRIMLMSPAGEVSVLEWQDQARALGVEFDPDESITIANDPESFGALSDDELLELEEVQVVKKKPKESTSEHTVYWCLIFAYGCHKSESRD